MNTAEKHNKFSASRLKELRTLTGLTQSKIAKEFYISRSCWSNYELGIREPSMDMIHKMSIYFDVDIRYLIADDKLSADMEEFLKQKIDARKYLTKEGYLNLPDLPTVDKLKIIDFYKYLKYIEK